MIALYLIAAHLVGDFVLQTRWQAAGKFTDRHLRLRHVTAYCVPFVAVLLVIPALDGTWLDERRGIFYPGTPGRVPQKAAFLVLLFALHYLTDSRRFHSTVGDWFAWWFLNESKRRVRVTADPSYVAGLEYGTRIEIAGRSGLVLSAGAGDSSLLIDLDLEPNPWPPIPILIDQTLHICQLAILGALFLS